MESERISTLSRIAHAPLSWMLHGVARLPFGVIYALSDAMRFIVHRVVRYRLDIVRDNLCQCYPDRDDAWLRATENEFYRNFCDNFFETVKLLHISDEEMRRHMTFENIEASDAIQESGRSVVAYFSHCGNWEWATSITLWSRTAGRPGFEYAQVYRPLKNRWFDALFLKLRSRFHSLSFKKRNVLRDLLRLRAEKTVSMTGFMSDQKPSHGDPTYVTEFLRRPTAMITGTETLARKLRFAAVYMDMYKLGRGQYKVVIRPIADDCSQLEPMEITSRYAAMLQETIDRNPAIWLWTHKRWKNPVTLTTTPESDPKS